MIQINQVGEVLADIYILEVPIRLEWVYDGGFVWALVNGQIFPRTWNDDGLDDMQIVIQTDEHARKSDSAQFLAVDWLERGRSDTINGAITDLVRAIIKHHPATKTSFAKYGF